MATSIGDVSCHNGEWGGGHGWVGAFGEAASSRGRPSVEVSTLAGNAVKAAAWSQLCTTNPLVRIAVTRKGKDTVGISFMGPEAGSQLLRIAPVHTRTGVIVRKTTIIGKWGCRKDAQPRS